MNRKYRKRKSTRVNRKRKTLCRRTMFKRLCRGEFLNQKIDKTPIKPDDARFHIKPFNDNENDFTDKFREDIRNRDALNLSYRCNINRGTFNRVCGYTCSTVSIGEDNTEFVFRESAEPLYKEHILGTSITIDANKTDIETTVRTYYHEIRTQSLLSNCSPQLAPFIYDFGVLKRVIGANINEFNLYSIQEKKQHLDMNLIANNAMFEEFCYKVSELFTSIVKKTSSIFIDVKPDNLVCDVDASGKITNVYMINFDTEHQIQVGPNHLDIHHDQSVKIMEYLFLVYMFIWYPIKSENINKTIVNGLQTDFKDIIAFLQKLCTTNHDTQKMNNYAYKLSSIIGHSHFDKIRKVDRQYILSEYNLLIKLY